MNSFMADDSIENTDASNFIAAIKAGDVNTVRKMLKAGIDPETRAPDDTTHPLKLAGDIRSVEITRMLVYALTNRKYLGAWDQVKTLHENRSHFDTTTEQPTKKTGFLREILAGFNGIRSPEKQPSPEESAINKAINDAMEQAINRMEGSQQREAQKFLEADKALGLNCNCR